MDEIKAVGESSTTSGVCSTYLPNDKPVSGGSFPVKSTYVGPETEQEPSIDLKPTYHTSDYLSTPTETTPDDSLLLTENDNPASDSLVQEVTLSPLGFAKGQNGNGNLPDSEIVVFVNKNSSLKVGDIDTAAPFESIKEAVSRFGCIAGWKVHRVQTTEKSSYIEQQQHEKPIDEIPLMKKKSEAAEEAKLQVLKELDSTKRLIEELKLKLERAQIKEHGAKQGITDDSSVAAKAQFEVAQARYAAAVPELAAVENELQNLRKDYNLSMSKKDIAVKRAQEATSALKDVEEKVQNLSIQLMMTKEFLELTRAAHLEAEEHRLGAALAREQDALIGEQELEQAQEELEKVNQQINSTEDQKSKLDAATALLHSLKTELAAYKESRLTQDNPENDIEAAKKNVEDVKQNIRKETEEIGYLKTAVISLETELEREKAALVAFRQREGMGEVVVASLESELNRIISEIALVQSKEKEARERMMELSKQLQKAAQEADQAKTRAQEAREELKEAKETVEQAKDRASVMASRLLAAQKEIEAAKASQKFALVAIGALHGPENELETGVTEEYRELSKKVREAEEAAHRRVATAISLIDEAKESELKSLSKFKQVTSELAARKQAFNAALQKAEKAKQGKLCVEQDLRKWRAEHEQRRKSGLPVGPRVGFEEVKSFNVRPISTFNQNMRPVVKTVLPESNSNTTKSSPEVAKKKKMSFFPRIYML